MKKEPDKPLTIQPPAVSSNTTAFIFGSILLIAAIGSAAIVAIVVLRPGEDNTALITSVVGFLAPTMAALLAFIKSVQTGAAVQELHLAVNSRLTELLEQTAKASKSEGRKDAVAAAAKVAAAATTAAASVDDGASKAATGVAAEATKAAVEVASDIAAQKKEEERKMADGDG